MNRISASLGLAALVLAGAALSAEDFQPLMKTTQATWPAKQHIGVICNYRMSEADVLALAKAAGEGAFITVADTRVVDQASAAANLLANHKTDFVVLMPQDRFFRDGSFGATVAVNQLARKGVPAIGTSPRALQQGAVFSQGEGTEGQLLVTVPAIGTSPRALQQGAVFSQGEGTEGQLLVTDRLIGTIDVILPDRARVSEKASLVLHQKGMATIAVHLAN